MQGEVFGKEPMSGENAPLSGRAAEDCHYVARLGGCEAESTGWVADAVDVVYCRVLA